ncbi:Chalcone-flavanone isomerase family protein [Thalictrum thalictroides]|uniref:Chalcone-flavanone isomerase family protein n=1 Tax=Thalictrum thalictroides TaxID=46969 RepID=A0A7J6VS78_THATH|nr:Chalcone-flavanone isomerase family protein [Thalictrum thalictroides]
MRDITRFLLFDFSDFSSCSSVLIEGSVYQEKSTEEDDASVWSIQVNTSTQDEDDEQEEIEEDEEEDADYEDEELVDELWDGLSQIFVQKKPLPEFEGKHTRFVYDSDGEIEGEEVVHDNSSDVSPTILRLNGLPTPAGKHLRFP